MEEVGQGKLNGGGGGGHGKISRGGGADRRDDKRFQVRKQRKDRQRSWRLVMTIRALLVIGRKIKGNSRGKM
jgi:hypothetical protein